MENERLRDSVAATDTIPGKLSGLLWSPSPNRLTIDSPLPPEEALARLLAGFNDEFRGKVEGNGVKVWRARDFSTSRGTFAPLFYGVVTPTEAGSQLSGHFQMHPVTRLYTAVWLGLSALLALIFLVAAAQRATPDASAADALPVLLVALLPLAGLLLVRLQQRKGRADEAAVRGWMGDVLGNSYCFDDRKRETGNGKKVGDLTFHASRFQREIPVQGDDFVCS